MTDYERAALVARARTVWRFDSDLQEVLFGIADLIEADGKRLALAEKTIERFRSITRDPLAMWHDVLQTLANYDAAKEAL